MTALRHARTTTPTPSRRMFLPLLLTIILTSSSAFMVPPSSCGRTTTCSQKSSRTALAAIQVDPRTTTDSSSSMTHPSRRRRTPSTASESSTEKRMNGTPLVDQHPTTAKNEQATPPPVIPTPSRLEELLERSRLPTRSSLNSLRLITEKIRCDNNEGIIDDDDSSSDSSDSSIIHQESDETTASESDSSEGGDAAQQQDRRKLAARAALLSSRSAGRRKPVLSKAAATATSRKTKTTTSIGERRTKSASKSRQERPGVTERIMDAMRKSAQPTIIAPAVSVALVQDTTKPTNHGISIESAPTANHSMHLDLDTTSAASIAAAAAVMPDELPTKYKLSASRIHAAMVEIMERQMKNHGVATTATGTTTTGTTTTVAPLTTDPSLGWGHFSPPVVDVTFPRTPAPGTILLPSAPPSSTTAAGKLQFPNCLTVRTATPRSDTEVAHLRLSVFSDFSPEVRRQLVSRSVKAVVSRRMQGATCLIATVPPSLEARKRNRPPVILGSAECSFHEFQGTILGFRRPSHAISYITEVAVSPNARRRGVGGKLLESVEFLANMRGVETLYLHVDVENKAALTLYANAGYRVVDNTEPMFLEFTTKLNLHDGATKGRNHFLLCKDLVNEPTWLPPPPLCAPFELESATVVHGPSEMPRSPTGTLGFEVPATLPVGSSSITETDNTRFPQTYGAQ